MKKIVMVICVLALSSVVLQAAHESKVFVAPVWEYGVSHLGNGTSQKGSLWGATVGYTYSEKDSVYFDFEFMAVAGKWNGSAGNDPTQEYVTEARFGYVAMPWPDRFTMTPFIGMGSYVFNQTSNFTSYFWYLPIGVVLEYQINQKWTIGLVGYGAPTFSGSYKIEGNKNSAPTSALWKAELPVKFLGSLPFELSIVPFFKGWSYRNHDQLIKQSNLYYGLKLGLGYLF